MPEEKNVFIVDTVSDKATGSLSVVEYDLRLQEAKDIVAKINLEKISNDADKKVAKEARATLNKIIKLVDRKRIDSENDFIIDFDAQMKAIIEIFDTAQKTLGANIKEYEDSTKIAVVKKDTKKSYKAVITFEDEKMVEKIKAFCEKNNLSYSIQ